MRTIILASSALCIAACGSSDTGEETVAGTALEPGLWTAGERDGLCVAGDGSAAFIRFGEGDANCMAQGKIEEDGGSLAFVPRGDEECRIPMTRDGDALRFGTLPDSCAYYCGGTAGLEGAPLARSTGEPGELRDVAGDPLC